MAGARHVGLWAAVAGLVGGVVLVVGGDVGAGPLAPVPLAAPAGVVGATRTPLPGGLSDLPALASVAPGDGFEGGGGGLAGATWGLFGDPADDSAVMRAVGVQVDLGAPGWGAGARYAVFEAGTTTPIWPTSGAATTDAIVPAGILRDGGAYEVAVTVDGVTTQRAFTVDATRAGSVSGVVTTSVSSTPVSVNTGQKMGLGVRFSSADVGVTPTAGGVGRLSEGLPAGWSWAGVGADVWKVEVVEGSASLPGVDRIVKVYGGGVVVLGCSDQAGLSVCDTADGQLVGEGPRAVIQADGSVVLTEQSVGQALTFDPDGRVVRIAQPGTPPVGIAYTAAGGLDTVTWEVGSTPLVWDVFYAGDADCDDSALPPGFAATPAGSVCGWTVPAGERTRILYTSPAGAAARVSRIVQLPDCAASMVGCDPNLTVIADYGWNESNQLSAVRDTLAARAVIAGLLDPADRSHEQSITYDGVARLQSGSTPSPVVDSRGRLAATATAVSTRVAYGAADAELAPATVQVAVTTTGAGGSLTTTTAVDDGGRTIGSRAASGGLTRAVWDPFQDVQLATIYPNDHAETTVFDRWFRRTGKHLGPIDAFGPACSPSGPDRGATDADGDWTACAPLAGTTRATSQLIEFDEPTAVEFGLTAAVFAPAAAGLPSPFSGNPVAHAAADQGASPDPGIPIAAVAPAAATGGGVRLDGGLVVPTSDGTESWTLTVEAPPSLLTTGVALVDGKFCAILEGGQGSCSITPDDRAQHVTIDIELARAPIASDRVVIEIDDSLGDPPVVDNSFLVRRWSTDTTLTRVDPVPAGTIADWTPTTVTEHDYDCGTATDPVAEQVACIGSAATAVHDPTGVGITRTYTYATDGFGGVRLASATKPDGTGATTFTHWGVDDTAAGLPNADQLGDLVSVPQRGLPKTTTLPGGRTTTTVHDEYGEPVCQAIDGGNWTCTTLDVTRRPLTHVLRSDSPGVAPVTITTDYAPAGNPLINRTSRTEGASRAARTEQIDLAPSGRILGYTDSLNTTTNYGYDGMGRLATTTITPPVAPGRAPRPRPPGAAAPGFTYGVSFDPSTGLQTGMTFQGQPLVSVAYGDGERPWLPTGYTYTLGAGATVAAEVNYDSDLNPYGRTWTLADGSSILDCATTAVAPAACTAEIGDRQPGTTASGRMLARTVDGNTHRFTYDTARRLTGASIGATSYGYGWDLNNNRTSRTVDGATTTFTYDGADRLIATTDPAATIGGFDADGNHAAVGADTYAYDALDQLASTTDAASGTTIAYVRDARARITTHRTTPGGTYFLGYSLPSDERPTLTIDAAGVATPLIGLPGGLLFRGSAQAPVITDMQGNTLLALTIDGRRPTSGGTPVPVQQYEPFGQPTPDSPADPVTGTGGANLGWQQNQSDGALTHVGVRALHTRLGTFLQPDPRPHGSQAGPYSYTNADPVNQADPTGLCVGWACVKYYDQFLQPIADAISLVACVLGFGVACFVASLARVAIAVLNFAADFKLHEDAAYDGVTLAMSFLNLAAAAPLFYESRLVARFAANLYEDTSAVDQAVAQRVQELGLPAAQKTTAAELFYGEGAAADNETVLSNRLDDLALWNTRAAPLARGISIVSVVGEYGARITSRNLFGCCWKLW